MSVVYMSAFLLLAFEDLSNRERERTRIVGFERARLGALKTSRHCGKGRFRIAAGADSLVAYK
jgi:hypothetical protein